jgi:hypothetical protein
MRRIAMLLAVTAGATAAAAHDRHQDPNKPRPRGCSAIEVTAPGLQKQPRDGRFSPRTALDLEFETRLEQPVYGDHVMRFKVFTPSGFLYQDISVPFTWPKPGKPPKGHKDDAAVRTASPARAVQQLGVPARRGGRDRDTVTARLPVAGTSITMSTLYGRWTVQAYLDDKTRPCSPLRPFTIRAD